MQNGAGQIDMHIQSTANMALAETLGTATLVFSVMAAVSAMPLSSMHPLLVALLFGLGFLVAFYAVSTISGGHLNPMVTLSMFFAGRMSLKLAVIYIVAQLVGALIGLLLAVWLFGRSWCPSNMAYVQTDYMHLFKTGLVQILITFMFTLVFLVVTANPAMAAVAGIVIAAVFGMSILAAASSGGLTGANSLSYFYSIISGDLASILVLAITPIIGAILAGILYKMFTKVKGEKLLVDCNGKAILDQCCNKQYVSQVAILDACGKPALDCDGCPITKDVVRRDIRQTHKQETYYSLLARRIEEETGIHHEGIMSRLVQMKEKARDVYTVVKGMNADGTLADRATAKFYEFATADSLDEVRQKASELSSEFDGGYVRRSVARSGRTMVPEDF